MCHNSKRTLSWAIYSNKPNKFSRNISDRSPIAKDILNKIF